MASQVTSGGANEHARNTGELAFPLNAVIDFADLHRASTEPQAATRAAAQWYPSRLRAVPRIPPRDSWEAQCFAENSFSALLGGPRKDARSSGCSVQRMLGPADARSSGISTATVRERPACSRHGQAGACPCHPPFDRCRQYTTAHPRRLGTRTCPLPDRRPTARGRKVDTPLRWTG